MKEALTLALEAFEESREHIAKHRKLEAIHALKKALAKQEQGEPVAWKEADEVECPVCKDKGFPWPKCGHITYLEPTPPQRTWVGLTDEEHMILYTKADSGLHDWARAIEAKLKEKNT